MPHLPVPVQALGTVMVFVSCLPNSLRAQRLWVSPEMSPRSPCPEAGSPQSVAHDELTADGLLGSGVGEAMAGPGQCPVLSPSLLSLLPDAPPQTAVLHHAPEPRSVASEPLTSTC